MGKPIILAVGGGKTYGKSYLMALYAREKIADDMYKSAKSKEEREQSYADFDEYVKECSLCLDSEYDDFFHRGLERAVKVIKEVAKEYNNGWIPVSERVPGSDKYILVSFENFSVPCVGRYEEDDKGGAFYVGDDDIPLIAQGMIVNAWMELPKPYKGE